MPEPNFVRPEPRKDPQKVPRTPEQIAKRATNQRPSPRGQPDKAIVNLRLLLPRLLVEQLSARAIREGVRLEAVVQQILEGVFESPQAWRRVCPMVGRRSRAGHAGMPRHIN
jgi:hypothetical protein